MTFWTPWDGKTLEYVMVPGLGEEADYEGLDVTGKIAVVSRGTINFGAKAENGCQGRCSRLHHL